jgi:hypothetical protein
MRHGITKKAALTNAEHQARWRKRNLIALTADAHEIVDRLATWTTKPSWRRSSRS